MLSTMIIRFAEESEKREATQHVIESMVEKVNRVNKDEVLKFLKAYNAKMTKRDVDEAIWLKCFARCCRVDA